MDIGGMWARLAAFASILRGNDGHTPADHFRGPILATQFISTNHWLFIIMAAISVCGVDATVQVRVLGRSAPQIQKHQDNPP